MYKNIIKGMLLLCLMATQATAWADISGKVYQDFNANGKLDAGASFNEPGAAGVTVTAYAADGSQAATATSVADGAYTLTGLTAGVGYRLEFTWVGDWLKPGAAGGTSVQFAQDGATAVNASVNNPVNYCQADPSLATPVYVNGRATGTNAVLQSWVYGGGTLSNLATQTQIGATYGLAYDRSGKSLYSSSWLKRHVGLPDLNGDTQGDLGNIFVTDVSTNSTVLWKDLTTLGINFGTIGDDASRGLGEVTAPSNDPTTFGMVGKAGIGDIDLSDNGEVLYLTNLHDKKLYAINVADKTLKDSWSIPQTCSNGDAVNMGLKYHQGELYIGQVCTAETSNLAGDLKATVYKFNGNGFANVLNFPLNYPRKDSLWLPWISQISSCNNCSIAQPLLSDIEFDATDGRMIIGLRDRFGDQMGRMNYLPTGSAAVNAVQSGDILGASWDGSIYILESNGKLGSLIGAGVNNQEGPSNGEFYYDNYDNANLHYDQSMGALALLLGRKQVTSTFINPTSPHNGNTGGVRYLNETTGRMDAAFQVYGFTNDPSYFGKANGLGDLELLCDEAPTEIGNRVWQDTDGDGIQDAGEPGIAGVEVKLLAADGTTVLGTATTAADGTYYFSNASGTSTASTIYGITALLPTTAYTVQFPTTVTISGTDYHLTTASAGSNRLIDSNAAASGAAPIGTTDIPIAGANNHSFDVGYTNTTAPTTHSLGNRVWIDRNNNGLADVGETTAPAGVELVLKDMDAGMETSTTTDADGRYLFSGLAAGSYQVCVTADNFSLGGVLEGYTGSTGAEQKADANTDVDGDDNGSDDIATGLCSNTVVLSDAEPLLELTANGADGNDGQGTADTHSNLTVDFGVVPPAATCTINASTITSTCINNGTPTNPADDRYVYRITATGTGVGSTYNISGGDTVSDVSYGTAYSSTHTFPIYGAHINLTLTDAINTSCALTDVAVPVPPPCSTTTPTSDIAVTKVADKSNVKSGDTLRYTITAKNNGPSAAPGVELTDALPTGVTYQTHNASKGTYDSATGIWIVGAMAIGETATLTIDVKAD